MAQAPATGGYWEVASDGGIFAFGGARFYGSMGGQHLNQPIVGMAATPDGRGYWLVASDGGIFAFGDAGFYGSMGGQHLNQPDRGDDRHHRRQRLPPGRRRRRHLLLRRRPFFGSMGGQRLNAPIVGMVNDINTGGYWEVAADGGVFSFGGPRSTGPPGPSRSTPRSWAWPRRPTAAATGSRPPTAGVFSFAAPFLGSMGGVALNRPIVGMAGF